MSQAPEPNRTLAPTGVPQAGAEDCIRAIGAPVRRRILRTLHELDEARSPNELAIFFGIPVSYVSYHVKVLRECGAIALTDVKQKRGAVEHFYASTVKDNGPVIMLLEATRSGDGKVSRGRGPEV